MRPFKDLSGQRFGPLVAVKFLGCASGASTWRCQCTECGTLRLVKTQALRSGKGIECEPCNRHNALARKKKTNIVRRPWSTVELSQLCSLWNKGHAVSDLAKQFNRTEHAIYRRISQQVKEGKAFPRAVRHAKAQMIGRTFGSRTVIARAHSSVNGCVMWSVRCKCGEESVVDGHLLHCGRQTACRKCAGNAPGKHNGPRPKPQVMPKANPILSFAHIRAHDRLIAARHAAEEAAFA
ncbi:hypothetical protein [Komagataeibacter xylinus]|uniref:Uncharacterized protein n=1 Tax=Komagataeibacter xylinus TaxID=28448 RepID=A0A857FNQ3_KOMXY|nr:hypothetical protein [Komagataeibacter xylinus]QHC34134.1 hypothetical protein FMA36_00145 [Komagataeibacter xylinus]